MDNDKLVLADGTEIMLESSHGIGALQAKAESKAAACALWEKFARGNLAHVSIKNAGGEVTGRYHGLVLDHIKGSDSPDGTVNITFCLREKTVEEILTERVEALESGQQTQDDAISDLGQAVSDAAEGVVE